MLDGRFGNGLPRPARKRAGRRLLGGLLLALVATRLCVPCGATELATPPLNLALEAPENWQRFEVRRDGLDRRVEFRSLDSQEILRLRYRGVPTSWMSPLNLLVDDDLYERRSHRVAYRFVEPWSRRALVLRGRSKSQRLHGVPLPLGAENLEIELATQASKEAFGRLTFDPESPLLFTGALDGRPIRVESLTGQPVPTGPARELLLGSFPLAGVFRISTSGRELLRFVQLPQEGANSRYEVAIERELEDEARYDAWLAFIVFDLMKDFIHSAR